MKLSSLLGSISHALPAGTPDVEVRGVVCDSRQVRPGVVFVAIHGSLADGWSYVDDAVQRGAVAIVSEHAGNNRANQAHVCVDDARRALARLASAWHGDPANALEMVGITGTNGKTTMAFMVRDMLRAAGRKAGLLSTVFYEFDERRIRAQRTTPEAPVLQELLAEMVGRGCQSAVMEVSSHALEQDRMAFIDFNVAVFTNLTRDHLDYHGNMETYFAAKRRLFEALGSMNKKAVAVINCDDPWGRKLLKQDCWKGETLTYGLSPAADVRAESIVLDPSRSMFNAVSPWASCRIALNLLGRYNISNALGALAAGGALGLPFDTMAESLSSMVNVPGRLEPVPTPGDFQVFVDYAHTDDALSQVLRALREITRGRLLVVFGCGGDRDRGKRRRMGAVAAEAADYAFLTSDNPRSEDPNAIISEIRAGFKDVQNFEVVPDRAQAIADALASARQGDVVLIAGKGHETFQESGNTTIPFDDREVAKSFFEGSGLLQGSSRHKPVESER